MTLGYLDGPQPYPVGVSYPHLAQPPVWLWGSTVTTPASSSPRLTAAASETCSHRLAFSLLGASEEPDISRNPPPRKNTTPLVEPLPHWGSVGMQGEGLRIKPELPFEVGGPQQHPARKHFHSALLLRVLVVRTSR
jgi:hypothetical protein